MNEKTMTLEELIQYAQEAKEQTEKERLAQEAKKNEACIKIIKKIIDRLKEKKGEAVIVKNSGTHWFKIDDEEYEVEKVAITLDDIKEVIDKIPALEATWTNLSDEPITVLEVTFSETKATEMLETDGSEDK